MGGTKTRKIFIIALVCVGLVLNGCSSVEPQATQIPPTNTPIPTNTIIPTNTLIPTNTIIPTKAPTLVSTLVQDAKDELVVIIREAFNQPDNSLECIDSTWIDDEIKLTCELKGFIDEPTDHTYLHWAFIQAYVTLVESKPEYLENNALKLITIAKFNGTQMLSVTDYSTIDKVIKGKITTEIEWAQEAEITGN